MALTFHGEQSDRSDALLRKWSVDRCHVRKKGMEGKLCRERHGFDHHLRNSPVLQSVSCSVSNIMVAWFGCLVFDGQRHCLCVFVRSRLVPVSGWLYHRVPYLDGCVQVGGYDLEKKNSWLILRSCWCTCFKRDDCRMRSLANFVFFRRLSNSMEDGNQAARLPCPLLPSQATTVF
jgi:hypothetical protein